MLLIQFLINKLSYITRYFVCEICGNMNNIFVCENKLLKYLIFHFLINNIIVL